MPDIIAYKNIKKEKDFFSFHGEKITCPEKQKKAKKLLVYYYNNFEEMHLKKQKVQIMKNGCPYDGFATFVCTETKKFITFNVRCGELDLKNFFGKLFINNKLYTKEEIFTQSILFVWKKKTFWSFFCLKSFSN